MSDDTAEPTGTDGIALVRELVKDIDVTMLTTQDAAGNLVSRPPEHAADGRRRAGHPWRHGRVGC